MKICKNLFVFLCISAGCAYFSRIAITYLPVHLQMIGNPKYYVGASTAFFGIGYFLGSYLLNHLTQSRNLVIYLIYLLNISGFAILFFTSYIMFPCIILGITFGYISAFINLVLLEQVSNQVTISVFRIFLNAGAAIGTFIYSILIDNYNVILLISTIFIIISYFFLKTSMTSHQQNTRKSAKLDLVKDKMFILFCLFDLLIGVIYSQFYLAFPIFLKINYASGLINFGIMSIIISIAIICLEYPLTKILKNKSKKWVFFFGAVFISASLGSLPLTHSISQVYLCFAFYIFGEIIYFPSATFAVKALCKDMNKLEIYVSYNSAISGLSIVLAPLLFTMIYTIFNINFIWYLCVGVSGLCVVSFMLSSKYFNFNQQAL